MINCAVMSASKEDVLSPDELRKRLYQTFKNKGVLDTLKAQFRNQLIQELNNPPLTGREPVPSPVPVKSDPLLVSACNSIVADHLRTSGYEYTLSVFCPESGLCKDKVFTKDDFLQFLKISPDSVLFTSLSLNNGNDKGFLINLLTQLTHPPTPSRCHDTDTQTTSLPIYGESLVEKMKMIDKEYEGFSYKEDKMFSFQSKLSSYRKETKAQLEAEMNTKLQHFKDVEIAKVRLEENSKFSKEFDKLRQELERTYELKAKALMDREKNAIDRLQKQQEIEEKNIYMQRQSVLKEIETLRTRENEMRMRMETFEKTCQIHEEKVRTAEELLRRRELAMKTMEDTYDQRLKNELSRYQLELKAEFIERTEKLRESENRNKVETARIQKESEAVNARLEDHSRACSELKRLQDELEAAQQQISLVTQQKELFREKLETMSDYSSLKKDKAELRAQLQLVNKQLEDAQEENRLLRADVAKPSKEEVALQVELQGLQSARRLDAEEFDKQRQVLQFQLQSEVERCAELKAQLMECEEKSQWMNNHIEDIKFQLDQTQQALENEVLRNPKPSLVDRSVLELSASKLVPPDVYVDRALLRGRAGYDDGCEAGHKSTRSDSPDSDVELVAGARARIEELQKEVEAQEAAYRNYQQRAAHTAISHMLPTATTVSPQQSHTLHRIESPLFKKRSSRTRSAHKPKISHKSLPPQNAGPPSLPSFGTRNTLLPTQRLVTFSEDPGHPEGTDFFDHSLQPFNEPLLLRNGHPQDRIHPQVGRLSSLGDSSPSNELQREIAEETAMPLAAFPALPSDNVHSRAPHGATLSSGDFSPELSSPHSPQLKSTARDLSSPPKLQSATVLSSSESSPHPEEICLDDLTEILAEPSHIPELLLDTAVPLSKEASEGPDAPHPQDLPEDLHGNVGVTQTSGESARVEEEEEEEQSWERERKEREERRQREQEEARERERQELERLEKEMLLKEVEQTEQEETQNRTGGDEELNEAEEKDEEEPKGENPLEKYMKIVLEAREKQRVQNPGTEEPQHTSSEAKSLSDKEHSIAGYSHKDEDDDFW
ncbi:centriole and centriolar satellite protein ofd1 isoform 2-T2 [Pholidichthys leucotaenia]